MTQNPLFSQEDMHFMAEALKLAQIGSTKNNEVPVGAVVVHQGAIIGSAHNRKEELQDATAHAEILALKQAQNTLQNWRLKECTMYVSLEPCLMCAGAILGTRLSRLIYGTTDPKTGAVSSLFNVLQDHRLNHQVIVQQGLLQEQCSQILKQFFKTKRMEN